MYRVQLIDDLFQFPILDVDFKFRIVYPWNFELIDRFFDRISVILGNDEFQFLIDNFQNSNSKKST